MRSMCKLWLTGGHLCPLTPAACPDGLSWVAAAVACEGLQHGARASWPGADLEHYGGQPVPCHLARDMLPTQAPCSVSAHVTSSSCGRASAVPAAGFTHQACPLLCQRVCGPCRAFPRACVCWLLQRSQFNIWPCQPSFCHWYMQTAPDPAEVPHSRGSQSSQAGREVGAGRSPAVEVQGRGSLRPTEHPALCRQGRLSCGCPGWQAGRDCPCRQGACGCGQPG